MVHIIYQYDIGGLEQVLTDCINHLPDRFQHWVISLTTISQQVKGNLSDNTELIALNKVAGNDWSIHFRLFKLLREIKPDIFHSYNLPTIEYQMIAFIARIKYRIHAEHGRDASDPCGVNFKYKCLRKLLNPFIHQWVVVSKDLLRWLNQQINIRENKINLIYNGIDIARFQAKNRQPAQQRLEGFAGQEDFVVGTVGRLDPVKNQAILIEVMQQLSKDSKLPKRVLLAIVGEGALRSELQVNITTSHLQSWVWLPGARHDIAKLMGQFDCFILPSIAEGVPMTLLEAMATELPVIAGNVGGIPEVINKDGLGLLVDPLAVDEIINAIKQYLFDNDLAQQYGQCARGRVLQAFTLAKMMAAYLTLYEGS